MRTDTFKIEGHEYRVHHDGDWTGGAEIVRPDGTSVRLPAALLRAIGARLFCSRALAAVEEALDGIDREVSRGGAEPSPTITYPEQKPPPTHPVQFVRGTAGLVLRGLTKGGEYASAEEFSASVSPLDALVLAADGRVVSDYGHACEAEARGAVPFTWYHYTSPNPSRTSDPG